MLKLFWEIKYQVDKLRLVLVRWWFKRQLKKALKDHRQSLDILEQSLSENTYGIVACILSFPLAIMIGIYCLLLVAKPIKRLK